MARGRGQQMRSGGEESSSEVFLVEHLSLHALLAQPVSADRAQNLARAFSGASLSTVH